MDDRRVDPPTTRRLAGGQGENHDAGVARLRARGLCDRFGGSVGRGDSRGARSRAVLGSGTAVWAALLAAARWILGHWQFLGGMLAARRSPQAIVAWSLCLAATVVAAAAWLHRPLIQACARWSLTSGRCWRRHFWKGRPCCCWGPSRRR